MNTNIKLRLLVVSPQGNFTNKDNMVAIMQPHLSSSELQHSGFIVTHCTRNSGKSDVYKIHKLMYIYIA